MEYVTVRVPVQVQLDERSFYSKLVVVKKFHGMSLEEAMKLKGLNNRHGCDVCIQHVKVTDA